MMHTMLPSILENMPQEYKTNARYLSKFVAGAAIGLYDASLNFVWNEVMIKYIKKLFITELKYFLIQQSVNLIEDYIKQRKIYHT